MPMKDGMWSRGGSRPKVVFTDKIREVPSSTVRPPTDEEIFAQFSQQTIDAANDRLPGERVHRRQGGTRPAALRQIAIDSAIRKMDEVPDAPIVRKMDRVVENENLPAKRKPEVSTGVTWQDVVDCHEANRGWSAADIAAHLGCESAYVRATGKRRNLRLPAPNRGGRPPRRAN